MFKCPDCGHIFDIPHEYEERHGFTHGPFEKWSVCPACGQSGYEEAVECAICGELVCKSEINTVSSNGGCIDIDVCDACYDKLEDEEGL